MDEEETALDPDLPIVDAHHHLWVGQTWSDDYAPDYQAADFLADAAGHNVVATVYAECGSAYRADGAAELKPVGETEFVVSQAQSAKGPAKLCAGVVGTANLRLGAAAGAVLDAHLQAGQGRFRGVRVQAAWVDDPTVQPGGRRARPGLLADAGLRAGVAEVARRGLVLDVWAAAPQLPELADLADAFPNLAVVCNHLGGLIRVGRFAERPEETFAQWRANLAELARRPNVALKLGGFAMRLTSPDLAILRGAVSSQAMAQAWAPIFETALDAFGPGRCLFESNFPVDKPGASYRRLWNAYKRLSRGLSEAERTALFSGAAARVYRLDLR
jgi:predicted TIM-barrel fold metal-dependent hydrolase